jgi:molecular chaperone HtpG
MLKGVLDCPELPLNVSRSYLQNSQYVSKISAHIVKKVCDKLNGLFNTNRENYEKFWDDIKTFVEYACMRDKKFYDKVKDVILYKTVTSEKTEYLTIKEYLEKAGTDKKVYYANDVTQQALYINMFKAQNIPVIIFDHLMDNQFITALEQYEEGMKFSRIDAETDAIKNESEETKNEAFEKLFKDVSGNERMNVSFSELKDQSVPAILTVSEESRRFEEMLKLYRMAHEGEEDTFASRPLDSTLVLNTSNTLIKKLLGKNTESESTKTIAKQIYTLSLIGQRQLTAKELSEFLSNSFSLLEKLDIE